MSAKHRVLAPITIHGVKTDERHETATMMAVSILDKWAAEGLSPVALVVKGTEGKLTMSGPEGGCIVLVKRNG